jgi:hypothetical protein
MDIPSAADAGTDAMVKAAPKAKAIAAAVVCLVMFVMVNLLCD